MNGTRSNNWQRFLLPLCIVFAFNVGRSQPVTVFELSMVRLDRGPFFEAQQADLHYLLSLDVDRLLAPFLRDAGLPTRVESYGNWENTGLDGHIGGHYLSASSLLYAATGDAEVKRRLDYMIDQLAECQKRNGNGYVGGIPNGKVIWEEIRQGKIEADNFSLNHRWVPLYNIHKLFAGLYDAAVIGKNATAKIVFVKLCDWFVALVAPLSDEQIQLMLKSEHGGMNEVLALAFELTHEEKYLALAKRFSHRFILDPLIAKTDQLTGLHANTQIPKVIGFKRIADLSNNESWSQAAEFFWQTVVDHRTVSIGGNSVREHFHPANDFSSMIESNQGPETCNTYNMLKLTKALYQSDPDPHYLDYYECATYNHILSSQHPDGGFVYFTPMRPRHYRVYSSIQESFWCCVGSGLENHGKYGELIYAHSGDDLLVNMFVASTLRWKDKGLTLVQETEFPFGETTNLKLQLEKKHKFKIRLRHPSWVPSGQMKATVNGKQQNAQSESSTYITLEREWKDGDVITLTLPMHTTFEKLPDGSSWGSFIHGPIVLAAVTDSTDLKGLHADDSRMGHVAEGKLYSVEEAPVIVTKDEQWLGSLKPVEGKPLTFSLSEIAYPATYENLRLVPFFSLHDKRYMLYWPMSTAGELEKFKSDLEQKNKIKEALKARTVDEVHLGEQQPEVEHNFSGVSTEVGNSNGQSWRVAKSWMSYELQSLGVKDLKLQVTCGGEFHRRRPQVLINEILLADASEFFLNDKALVILEYKLSAEMLQNQKLVVKFISTEGDTGRIFSIALLKP